MMGSSPTGMRGLGRIFVYGYSRVPSPPAMMTTGSFARGATSTSSSPANSTSSMRPALSRSGTALMLARRMKPRASLRFSTGSDFGE